MQNMDKFPALHRFKLMYKSVTYFLGFASAVASTFIMLSNYIPAALSPASSLAAFEAEVRSFSIANELATTTPLEIGTGAVLLFTSIVWLASYQLGLYLNLKYSGIGRRKKVSLHFQTLLMSPVVGLVETFPAFWA